MFKEFKLLFQRPFTFSEMNLVYANKQLKITNATLNNLDELMLLQAAVYPGQQPWLRQTYMYELTRRNSIYLMMETDDQLIAVLGISKKSKSESHITNLSILPGFQNQGLGHLLLDLCFKIVRDGDFDKLTLEVDTKNQRAINLYTSLGFYETKTIPNYYDNGHSALELCKQIKK